MQPLVTLTSDLGEQEPNVATIKGVLLSKCPNAQLVDLSHQITCRQLLEGALYVASAAPFFPEGTIHLVNVSPGPQPIAVKLNGQYFVCPDNGVLSLLCDRFEVEGIRAIAISQDLEDRNRQIFFGREVFAPAAGALASGTPLEELGPELTELHRADLPSARRASGQLIEGEIIHIDRFGTLVTNIHESLVGESTPSRIEVGHFPIFGLSQSYTDVAEGKPLALFGSTGYLEIAYNGDRAEKRLGMNRGILVKVALE